MTQTTPISLSNIGTKSNLERILGVSSATLTLILKNKLRYYNVFEKKQKSKTRTVEEPLRELKTIQKRILVLLNQIDKPSFVFGSVKGKSYIDNAELHSRSSYVLTVDVQKFYVNVKREYVFRFFRYNMQNPDDVAYILTELTTFNNHLPTGACTSPCLSYLIFSKIFNAINNIAQVHTCKFSLYIDDMTFSSFKPIKKSLLTYVQKRLSEVMLNLHPEKIQNFKPHDIKTVTGCSFLGKKKLFPKNAMKDKFEKLYNSEMMKNTHDIKKVNSLIGMINAMQQIQPCIFQARKQELQKFLKI